MCLTWIKRKYKQSCKEWIYCDIEELHKKNEKAKLWAATFVLNFFIFMGFFFYASVNNIDVAAIIALILEVYCILMAADSAADRNRINMWIYLKTINKEGVNKCNAFSFSKGRVNYD